MANFESGVARYIKARAVVEVGFPVDWRGNVEISCKHCPFFRWSTRQCGLNQSVVNFPDKYIGDMCPLEEVIEDGNVEESTV